MTNVYIALLWIFLINFYNAAEFIFFHKKICSIQNNIYSGKRGVTEKCSSKLFLTFTLPLPIIRDGRFSFPENSNVILSTFTTVLLGKTSFQNIPRRSWTFSNRNFHLLFRWKKPSSAFEVNIHINVYI